jgi:hypothetical protein
MLSKPLQAPTATPPYKATARACALSLLASMAVVCSLANAQGQPSTNIYNIVQPQRLTDWLKANPAAVQDAYLLATAWTTPEATQEQVLAHQALVSQLNTAIKNPSSHAFFQWLQQQAPTGRMFLPAIQTEWLEANPVRVPVLRPGDSVITQSLNKQVTLLTGSGQACHLAHTPGAYPADYLQACVHTAGLPKLTVWIVQANGRTQAVSVAPWNPMLQPQLAPHAIIWTGWAPEQLQDNISESTRHELNAATASWLSKRTDSLAAWTTSQPSLLANAAVQGQGQAIALVTPADYELTGISQARLNPQPSASDWGVVGLIQTPTARMRPAGSMSFTYQRTWPYTKGSVIFQPLDWLEAGFRYTDIANRLYGPAELSGNQSRKDKSFEMKARLWPESTYLPRIAAGIRDLGGTGLFGGEYLVANKRWGRLDFSAGMGWGYVGGRQNLSNPLSVISKKFDIRQNDVGLGGTVSTKAFFRGPAAVFGGLEYQAPWNMVLKAEYDGNNYRHEPLGNNQLQKSALNFGLVHKVAPGIDLSFSRQRGTTWGIGFTFYSDLSKLNQVKLNDKPTPPVANYLPASEPNWVNTRKDIDDQTQWSVSNIQREGNQLILNVTNAHSPYHGPRVDKAMAVLHRDAPASIEHIELRLHSLGDVMVVDRIKRQAWVESKTEAARTDNKASLVATHYPEAHSLPSSANLVTQAPDLYNIKTNISLNHIWGGPDAFLLYQLNAGVNGQLSLPGKVFVSGALNVGLINNYDQFKYTAPSDIPRVRTYQREFVTTSRINMTTLYAVKAERLSTNWSAAAYGGFLESMYAGVGGEVLYRQPGSRWAAGVDLNRVQQRDFAQHFALRDYKAKTGNLTLYWQTPWQDINMALSAGQYLAGDKGATMSLTKVFGNGVTMGAFATKTNLSAAQFGEGSFNKGVYWTIPFDAIMTSSSRTTAFFNWTPLTRDGGAILNRPVQLMGGTNLLDPRVQTQKPASRPMSN